MEKQILGYANADTKFTEVIDILEGLTNWNPPHDALKVPALRARQLTIKPVIDVYDAHAATATVKTGDRTAAYLPLDSIVKRVYAAAISCKMTQSTIDKIKTLKDLIDGTNIGQATALHNHKVKKANKNLPEGVAPVEIKKGRSVSQQSFSLRSDNFKSLIALLTAAENYKTNTPDLTLEALTQYLTLLRAADTAANTAKKAYDDTNAAHHNFMSHDPDSIRMVVENIKAELKSMEGPSGVNYKKVVAIKFKILNK